MSRLAFRWPPNPGDAWSPQAAERLVGQLTIVDGRQAKVVAAELDQDGALAVELEVVDR